VPYLVISRSLKDSNQLIGPLLAFLCGLFVAAAINVVESLLGWHVYNHMMINLTGTVSARYEYRVGILRAFGAMDRPSQSGFAMAMGLGLLWALAPALKRQKFMVLAMCGAFALALLLTFARASWVSGAALLALFVIYADSSGARRYAVILGALVLVLATSTQLGDQIIELLPFIGNQANEAAGPIDYRIELFNIAFEVSKDNPLFGNPNYGLDSRLDAIRQPSGLLDIVNHYILLVLHTGYLSLFLYVMIFASVVWQIRKSVVVRDFKNFSLEDHVGFVLSLTIVALLLAIAGTSALSKIGTFLWSLAGLGTAFLNVKQASQIKAAQSEDNPTAVVRD